MADPEPARRTDADSTIPERFDPVTMRGEMAEAEHMARYGWATAFAEGRRILDAGCGTGYGAAMLAAAGATRVVGVDRSTSALAAARRRIDDPAVEFVEGDLVELDVEDDQFDLAICFEVIEHVADRPAVVRELKRALTPEGLLLVSSPNRDVYVPGNPHHAFEYRPEELESELGGHFEHVGLRRQHGWFASMILDDEALARDDGARLGSLLAAKIDGIPPGRETYTIALASDAPLPAVPQWATLAGTVEIRRWLELYDQQDDVLRRQREQLEAVEARLVDEEALRRRAEDAERRAAPVPALIMERDAAWRQADWAHAQEAAARDRAAALADDESLHHGPPGHPPQGSPPADAQPGIVGRLRRRPGRRRGSSRS